MMEASAVRSRRLVWLLLLQACLVLPFIGQAIHLDDPIYIDIGRNSLKVPSQPMDFPYCLESVDRKSTRLNSSHVSESRMPSSA